MHATAMTQTVALPSHNEQRVRGESTRMVAFIAVHAPLALIIYRVPAVAALHALIAFSVGLWAALCWRPQRVASVGAYIVGAELLWRMSGAPIPWEFGKYAITVIFFTAMLRMGRSARWRVLPLLYFAALLPSIIVVLNDPYVSRPDAINMLSFNLSGPLSLFASAWFLSQVRFTSSDTRRLLTALIAPVVGIAAVTLMTTYTASHLSFTDESNFVTSGGFGPNQVSVILGLGAMASLFYTLDPDARQGARWCAFGTMLVLAMQSAMTFSRGGLYSAGGAILAASWYLLRDRTLRRRLLMLVIGGTILTSYFILPRLDSLTNGELLTRFSDTNPSHRGQIMLADLRIWSDHPVLGVGPGEAKADRHTVTAMSHTEYTRLLSEHGLLGLFAMAMLAAICMEQVRRRQNARGKALAMALLAWSLLSMMHVDMRVAALGFVFGLGNAGFYVDREERDTIAARQPL